MPRPDVSAERKPQILEAALKVFARKGFDAARMEDIAQEAGLSIGGVYWYYKSKAEVIVALMQSVIDKDVLALRALLGASGTVIDRLRQYIRATAAQSEELAMIEYELYELALREAKVRKHVRSFFTTYREVLAEFVKQGVERGEFRSVDINLVAKTFAALYEGMLEMALLDPQSVDAETTLLAALDLLMKGLAP